MKKTFISQNIRKETSPYSIQLYNTEGGYWEDVYPFKNTMYYNTSVAGHQPGEPINFRIWPVSDPDYLELRFVSGNEGVFYWESSEDGKSAIIDGSTLYCVGGFNSPCYCNFNIYVPAGSSTIQNVELDVFLGGESGEFIYLGSLHFTHDQFLLKKWTCTQCGYVYEGVTAPVSCPICKGTDFITT